MNKLKALLNRGKAAVALAIATVSTALFAVCASAETTETVTDGTKAMMESAGEQLTTQFTDLVGTIVPVIIGILGSGLVIFGIIALIKLAKKVFGKVAG